MAQGQGLVQGFAQGYGLVSGIQNEREDRKREQQRYEDRKAYRQQRLGMQREQQEYARERDEVEDERWEQSFEADQEHRERQYGLQKTRVGISAQQASTAARRNDLAAQQQEMELAQMRRQEREQKRRRTLTAAAQELQTNGPTQRFRSLAKQGDIPIDQFNDPGFRQAKETVIAGLEGAPVDHGKMVEATGKLFQNRIDRVVGSETADGREIVRAQLDDFVPGPDGDTAMLDLKVWARDDQGNVEEYKAPVTSNRSAEDEYVLQVPVKEAVGYVKGLDILDKAVPRQQLASVIEQEMTLSGGGENGDSDSYWVRGPGNTLFNRRTGQTQDVPTVSDDKKRYSEALSYARKDYEDANEYGEMDEQPQDERRRWIQERRDMYLDMMTPEERIEDPDPSVIRKLQEEGGQFVAPGGRYEGRTVMLRPDGTVVVR